MASLGNVVRPEVDKPAAPVNRSLPPGLRNAKLWLCVTPSPNRGGVPSKLDMLVDHSTCRR